MILPFKIAAGAPAAPATTVAHTNIREYYPNINQNTAWSTLAPYIRQAIRTYVLPFIGRDLYEATCQEIQADIIFTDKELEFVERLCDVCAHYAIMEALPKNKTILSNMGSVEKNATENTISASLWGFKTTLWAVSKSADTMMDELLCFLQDNLSETFGGAWKADTKAYLSVSDTYFRTSADFQKYYDIGGSMRVFKRLVPIIRSCTDRHILPALCSEQHEALIQVINNGTPGDEYQTKLIELVRKALAHWTIYEASMIMPVISDADGFRPVSNADAVDQRAYSSEVTQSAIQGIRESSEKNAKTFTADLGQYLYDNAEHLPIWASSSCNKSGDFGEYLPLDPDGYGGVFI